MEYLPGGESLVGDAAEISAGTGALLELLAPAFPNITWTPTEFIPPQRVTSSVAGIRALKPRHLSADKGHIPGSLWDIVVAFAIDIVLIAVAVVVVIIVVMIDVIVAVD